MKYPYQVFGIVIGVAAALIILLVRRLTRSREDYDERQIAARGKAYQVGMIAMMFYIGIYVCLLAAGIRFADELLGPSLAVIFGGIAFGITAILKDAYISLNETPRSTVACLALIGISNILIGSGRFASGKAVEDGVLTFEALNFFIGVFAFLLAAVYVVRLLALRAAGKEDSEEDAE